MKQYISIGSISRATHRPEDLIPAFISILKAVYEEDKKQRGDEAYSKEIHSVIEEGEGIIESGDFGVDGVDIYLNEDLFNAMQEYCPPYTMFGAHEGDGSDFGVWINWDVIKEDAREEGNVIELDMTPELGAYMHEEQGMLAFVGCLDENLGTLYERDNSATLPVGWREVWAV